MAGLEGPLPHTLQGSSANWWGLLGACERPALATLPVRLELPPLELWQCTQNLHATLSTPSAIDNLPVQRATKATGHVEPVMAKILLRRC